MERLEEMIHQHNELAWVACKEDIEMETNAKIDENCLVIEEYQKKLDAIRTAEITTFHEMDEIINPPGIPTDGSVMSSQPASQEIYTQ